MKDDDLKCALIALVAEIHSLVRELRAEHEWRRSHEGLATKHDLIETEKRIMATQKEMAEELVAAAARQRKTIEEIKSVQTTVDKLNAKILELEGIITAGGEATPELIQAVAEVKALAQTADEQIPDLVLPPPTV